MSPSFSRVSRSSATALFLGAVLTTTAGPATATLDPGPPVERERTSGSCPLERVGTQFVRCDDLTGNGLPAPSFLPSR